MWNKLLVIQNYFSVVLLDLVWNSNLDFCVHKPNIHFEPCFFGARCTLTPFSLCLKYVLQVKCETINFISLELGRIFFFQMFLSMVGILNKCEHCSPFWLQVQGFQ